MVQDFLLIIIFYVYLRISLDVNTMGLFVFVHCVCGMLYTTVCLPPFPWPKIYVGTALCPPSLLIRRFPKDCHKCALSISLSILLSHPPHLQYITLWFYSHARVCGSVCSVMNRIYGSHLAWETKRWVCSWMVGVCMSVWEGSGWICLCYVRDAHDGANKSWLWPIFLL